MKTTQLSLVAFLLFAGASGVMETAGAQASTRAYRDGPVITVSYIRTKPGMFDRYMQYLDGPYKTNLEAQKAAGIVLDYGIYTSEPRTSADHDVMLTVVYKNWGALDTSRGVNCSCLREQALGQCSLAAARLAYERDRPDAINGIRHLPSLHASYSIPISPRFGKSGEPRWPLPATRYPLPAACLPRGFSER